MARKILGQAAPAATTNTDVYTCASGKTAVCSVVVVNRAATTPAVYRIYVIPSGDSLATKHYLAFDFDLPGKSGETVQKGITLAAGDKIGAYCDTANLTVHVYGDES